MDQPRRQCSLTQLRTGIAVVLVVNLCVFFSVRNSWLSTATLRSPRPRDDFKAERMATSMRLLLEEAEKQLKEAEKELSSATSSNTTTSESGLLGKQWLAAAKAIATKDKRKDKNIDTEARRFVFQGNDLACYQFPLLPELSSDASKISRDNSAGAVLPFVEREAFPAGTTKFAYVWYVASVHYLCSAIVAMRHLRAMRNGTHFPYQVDYVITYVKDDLPGSDNQRLLSLWSEEGGKAFTFPSLKKYIHTNGYYKASLQKFHSFLLTDYARVVLMDADGVPLADLDHLFTLRLPKGVELAAPQGYWFNGEGITKEGCKEDVKYVFITSVLLLIVPSQALYNRAEQHFGSYRTKKGKLQNFDMDIINLEFACKDEILVLPKHYGTLDSDLEWDEKVSTRQAACRDFSEIQYLHFTAKGKPWTHGAKTAKKTYFDKRNDPHMDKLFHGWFDMARAVCPQFMPKLRRR